MKKYLLKAGCLIKEVVVRESKRNLLPVSIIVASIAFSSAWIYTASLKYKSTGIQASSYQINAEQIIPEKGVTLPVTWGDIGKRMVESGVIDQEKFDQLYATRGGLSDSDKRMVYGEKNGKIVINPQNSGVLLNLLWAFGLSNENDILTTGPITDKSYGGSDRFASTGGWTLSKGGPMDHFNMHAYVPLTKEQQDLVTRIASTIYRPCCDNPTHFPDCNHGMAMLGLLELMASQGVSEKEMYRTALVVNSYWFPENYQTIASFLASRGIEWKTVDPKDILGANFSSASGFRQIQETLNSGSVGGGSGCGA